MFGAPGVGKGTQGRILGQIPGFFHFATGDMFRGLDPDSDIGREIQSYSSRGELVPDELTVKLWRQYVQKQIDGAAYRPDADLLVLDGIPRSCAQAKMLDAHVDVLGVIHLTAPTIDSMVERMKRRAALEGRSDDADESVIRRRFEVYDRETAPVLKQYDASIVHNVNALATPVEVFYAVLAIVAPLYAQNFGNPLGGNSDASATSGGGAAAATNSS